MVVELEIVPLGVADVHGDTLSAEVAEHLEVERRDLPACR